MKTKITNRIFLHSEFRVVLVVFFKKYALFIKFSAIQGLPGV